MKPMSQVVLAVLVSAAVAAPVVAQNLAQERGKIVSANWQTMEVEIKDPRNRVGTWKVRPDAVVVFTDKKSDFPNPKLADLRAPMYVYFTFDADTKVVSRFEVREVGFDTSQGGPGVQRKGVITNLDASAGHIQVNLGAGPQTFEVDPKGQLGDFRVGDSVSILVERRESNREVVTLVRRVGSGSAQTGPGVTRSGVITNLDANIGHVEVNLGAGPQTFAVDPKGQLGSFRIGDRVSILVETRDGNREVVTKISRQ
jgi:Cu/Ag efflux protein CusF